MGCSTSSLFVFIHIEAEIFVTDSFPSPTRGLVQGVIRWEWYLYQSEFFEQKGLMCTNHDTISHLHDEVSGGKVFYYFSLLSVLYYRPYSAFYYLSYTLVLICPLCSDLTPCYDDGLILVHNDNFTHI